jgi:hypothetical protein
VNTEGTMQIENEETLVTLGIQDENKQNKNTTQKKKHKRTNNDRQNIHIKLKIE